MMIKIFLISACVAASANGIAYIGYAAGWEWNFKNPSGSRNRRNADSYSQFANIADFPGILDLPNFKTEFPDIKISPEDIASHKGPDRYHSVSMVTINGETVVTINKDGNVNTFKVSAGSSKEKISAILAGTV